MITHTLLLPIAAPMPSSLFEYFYTPNLTDRHVQFDVNRFAEEVLRHYARQHMLEASVFDEEFFLKVELELLYARTIDRFHRQISNIALIVPRAFVGYTPAFKLPFETYNVSSRIRRYLGQPETGDTQQQTFVLTNDHGNIDIFEWSKSHTLLAAQPNHN